MNVLLPSRLPDLSTFSVSRPSPAPRVADAPETPNVPSTGDGLIETMRRHAGDSSFGVEFVARDFVPACPVSLVEAEAEAEAEGAPPCRRVLRAASAGDFAAAEAWLADWPGGSYLVIERAPWGNRRRLRPLLSRVEWVQLSAPELRSLTNFASIPQGINRLRSWGCRSIVVTDGPGGTFAFHAGEWSYAAGLRTARVESSAADDVFEADMTAGVILAGLQRGAPLAESLRVAIAEAARRPGVGTSADDWQSLLHEYAAAPKRGPRHAPHLALRLASTVQRHPVASAVASTAAAALAVLAAAYGVMGGMD